MLNHESPLPLYQQLATIIMDKIRQGEYKAGTKIPSEPTLAKTFGVGRPTVRQATDILVRKRILKRVKGSGTFVSQEHRSVNLFSLAGTSSAFQETGISIYKKILQAPQLVTPEHTGYNPFFGDRAFYFRRISCVDDVPILIEDFYLNATVFVNIDRLSFEGRSLSRIVEEEYFLSPSGGKQYFKTGYPTEEIMEQLALTERMPILIVHRYLDFGNIESGIYSIMYCRTDKFDFSQTLGGLNHGIQ